MTGSRFRVLYACVGNVCRSVLAAGITRRMVNAQLGSRPEWLEIGSAGTEAIPGQPIHPYVRDLLRSDGPDGNGFASRRLTAELVAESDLVLAATVAVRDRAISVSPAALRRTFTINEFARLAAALAPVGAGDPVARAQAVVAAAQRMRGRIPYVDPVYDDIPDPRPTPAAFQACAARIAAALAPTLEALCPEPAESPVLLASVNTLTGSAPGGGQV